MNEEKILDDIKFCLEGEYITREHYEAIQGLLDLYNKEKEKNEELSKNFVELCKTAHNDFEERCRLTFELEEREARLQEEINEVCKLKAELYGNSISKDKIKEKIKELERRLRNEYDLYERTEEKSDEQYAIHRRINMLNFVENEIQELLEEE